MGMVLIGRRLSADDLLAVVDDPAKVSTLQAAKRHCSPSPDRSALTGNVCG